MLPFVLPYRERLDQNPGFQQHIVGNVGQGEFGVEEFPTTPMQEHRNVRIAVRAMVSARAAAEKNRAREFVLARHLGDEGACSPFGIRVDILKRCHDGSRNMIRVQDSAKIASPVFALSVARRARKAPADAGRASVAELARLLRRAEPNVSRTLGKLVAAGFVRLKAGAGKMKVPEVSIHRLTVDIDVYDQTDRVAVA